MTIRVAILSLKDDLHALVVQKVLNQRRGVVCHIIETDQICNSAGLTWSDGKCSLATRNGERIDPRNLDVVWLRRFNLPQELPSYIMDLAEIDVINNDCKAAILGLLANEFSGGWVNNPEATQLAENKLMQLRVAKAAGFRTPHTLVSQDPETIKAFCATLRNNVIVKVVRGTSKRPLFTSKITDEHLQSEAAMRLAPAVYQEYIPGRQHIRAHCFGDTVHAVVVESAEIDWRRNLNVPIKAIELAASIKTRLRRVLKALRLKMGVFDFKLDNKGEPVWLEINPQGQFLFIEGLSGLKLSSAMADFLCQEAQEAKNVTRLRGQGRGARKQGRS